MVVKPLRILFFDIETTPQVIFKWDATPQYISMDQIIHDSFMCSWAAKWSDRKSIMSDHLEPHEIKDKLDARIVHSLAELVREADVVCAHNADGFDIPYLNGRIFVHGMEPLGPTPSIDTLKLSKKNFRFSHHKLDNLQRLKDRKGKIKTDFDLWKDVYFGDEGAMRRMVRYNRQDVVALEETFEDMKPYVNRLMRLMDGTGPHCPDCGSDNLHRRGTYRTQSGNFPKFQCQTCGGYHRGRKSEAKLDYHPL